MRGVLTALLGGAQGLAEGVEANRQYDLKRQAEDLERAKLRADLFLQGLFPVAGGQTPAAGATPDAQMPQPSPSGVPTPTRGVLTSLLDQPNAFGQRGPRAPATAASLPAPALPGGMSGTDALRAAASRTPPQSSSPAPTATPTTSPSAATGFDLSAFGDGQTIELPGMGSYRYDVARSPIARQIIIEAINRRNATDEDVRKANLTGETMKNLREASRLQLGDPGYSEAMGGVAGAQAAARMPYDIQQEVAKGRISLANGTALANLRGQIEQQLQKNQQDFEGGKITLEQRFQRDQQARQLEGEFLNQSTLTNQRARGTFSGKILAPSASTAAPSASLLGGTTGLFGDLVPITPPGKRP